MNTWDPEQYKKFEKERDQPFDDLVQLVEPEGVRSIIDLGCGTGRLTKRLHERMKAERTLGIDSSKEMLSESYPTQDLIFKLEDITKLSATETYDLVFSNAALQWIPDHVELFLKLKRLIAPKGQLAIQMPANHDMPTHLIANRLARTSPFKEILGPVTVPSVLPIEAYAEILYQLGFNEQKVVMKVYPHLLDSSLDLVEWVKGSLLSYYRSCLPKDLYERFLKIYSKELMAEIGMQEPYFYPFKRILIWAKETPLRN